MLLQAYGKKTKQRRKKKNQKNYELLSGRNEIESILELQYHMYCLKQDQEFTTQAPVVRRLDNAIHRIRLDNTIRFDITYPPDSDLSVV